MAKRVFDVVAAAALLVLLSPVIAVVAVLVYVRMGTPVLFRQRRPGHRGRPFTIMKFRTMCVDADARKHEIDHLNKHTEEGPRMFKIPNDPRITPFGRFLRKWSLDEIPQLINVVRGEMSLVGPRPLILREDEILAVVSSNGNK